MDKFAECAIKYNLKKVEAYLATFPGSKEARTLAVRLSTTECLSSGALEFNELAFRSASYQRLYKIKFEKSGPTDFSTVAPIDYSVGATEAAYRDPDQMIALRQFADCVVRASPTQARALILGPIGTPVEQTAFQSLAPHLSGCLPKDQTLKFSKSVLRGLIGETLYRLSVKAQQGAGDA